MPRDRTQAAVIRDAALLATLAFAAACERAPPPVAATPRPVAATPTPAANPRPARRPVVAMQQAPVAADVAPPTLAVYALSRGKGVPDEARATLKDIRALLDAARKDGRVTDMASTRIGIEGETRLCVEFRDAAAAAALGAEVRAAARDVELLNVVEERCPDGEERK